MSTTAHHLMNLLLADPPDNKPPRTAVENAATKLVIDEPHLINDPFFYRTCIDFHNNDGDTPDHIHDNTGCDLPNNNDSAYIKWHNVASYRNAPIYIPLPTRWILDVACSMTVNGYDIELGFIETIDSRRRVRIAQALIAAGGDQDTIIGLTAATS